MRGIAVAILILFGVREKTRRPSVVACTPRYGPILSLHQQGLIMGGTKGKI